MWQRLKKVFSGGPAAVRPVVGFVPPDAEREEMAYWESLLASGRRPEYVTENLAGYLRWLGGAESGLRILDVGCGPFPFLAAVAGENLVVGADPLARQYASLRARHGVSQVVPILPLAGEELEGVFASGVFDLIECNNALDHARDPVRVFGNMLALARPGGAVHIAFMENERTHEGGRGFHSWDLSWDGAGCRIAARGGDGRVSYLACGVGGVDFLQCDVGHDGAREWFNVYIRKGGADG